ncbi:hypothetical protein [Roseicyclus persicicus]|uniref:Lectin-like protein BA14k n=1 Tax=Roseicyclus persicicus TaxID=2650661 RepID=A0A7X6JXN4_9RHOB|nr:hypothetical protein [Roseibacterium persicicum]NKX43255.1 hypothetical protein [Roseibacterium persicicum]
MFRSLRSSLSAFALAAAVALGGLGATAAPARADADDAARILGGIIALYAIGRAIEMSNDRNHPTRQYHVPAPHGRIAPAHCYVEFPARDGYFRGYSGPCLQHSVRHGLPDACARDYHTQHGRQTFYGARCMSQHGWQHEIGYGH